MGEHRSKSLTEAGTNQTYVTRRTDRRGKNEQELNEDRNMTKKGNRNRATQVHNPDSVFMLTAF